MAHLTIGIKFNVSFMRNKGFYENLQILTSFLATLKKMFTFPILATTFAQITNLKIETYSIFQVLCDLKVSIALRKI